MKKWLYLTIGVLAGVLVVGIFFAILHALDQQKTRSQIEHYLAENYPELDYEILGISTSTDSKYYGYFDQSISVKDKQKREIFYVYYEESMERMEDSRKLRQQETFLETTITPAVKSYVATHFGDVHYINVDYLMETRKPLITLQFNEGDTVMQANLEALTLFVKEVLALEHAHIIMEDFRKETRLQEEF